MAPSEVLERAWTEYGGAILTTRHGRNKARCPLHDDRVASASVNLDNAKWTCFAGCGYGDVYELIKLAENQQTGANLSFPQCTQIAAERFGDTDSSMGRPLRSHSRKGWKPAWV